MRPDAQSDDWANSRGLAPYSLSKRAHSATMRRLRFKRDSATHDSQFLILSHFPDSDKLQGLLIRRPPVKPHDLSADRELAIFLGFIHEPLTESIEFRVPLEEIGIDAPDQRKIIPCLAAVGRHKNLAFRPEMREEARRKSAHREQKYRFGMEALRQFIDAPDHYRVVAPEVEIEGLIQIIKRRFFRLLDDLRHHRDRFHRILAHG